MQPPAAPSGEHLPLCDLGFGPLACFVTLKPLSSCSTFAAHISTASDSMQFENTDKARGDSQELQVQDVHQKAVTVPDVSHAKQKQYQYAMSDNDSPSLQSFTSGGSSPSSARPRQTRPRQGLPVRHLTGEMTGKGDLKASSKLSLHEHASKHEGVKTHHTTGIDELDRQLLLDAWKSCRLMEAKRTRAWPLCRIRNETNSVSPEALVLQCKKARICQKPGVDPAEI